jgi:predicted dehydrogenase/nucleoside-diphosphate-sugar epimerase
MRVGIIGGGEISKIHRRAISTLPYTKIVGVADSHLTRAKDAATELQAVPYTDAELMIREQKPDVVHVLTPPESHAELGMMAMRQGCHVLVEKPLALNLADAQAMFRVAEQNRVKLCVDHNFLFAKVFRRAIDMARSGTIGSIVSVEANYRYNAARNPAILEQGAEHCHWSYRLNGGPLQDLMPHPASLVMELMSELDEVQVLRQNRGVLPTNWSDEIRILLKSGDKLGSISISLSERPDILSLSIHGTDGIIRANVFDNSVIIARRSSWPRALARGISGFQTSWQFFKSSTANLYELLTGQFDKSSGVQPLIAAFYQAIQEQRESPVTREKSLNVVDLVARVWPVPAKLPLDRPSATRTRSRPSALVTGASGFIGTHLLKKLLSEGIKVRGLVRPNSIHAGRLKNLDVEVLQGDLADPEVLGKAACGIKTIYHLGAAMTGSWQDNHNATIKGTEYLVQAAISAGVERLVHVSSLVVYELLDVQDGSVIQENAPYQKNPLRMGPYAHSKTEAEKIVFTAHRNHGLKVTVVRPGMVIGPFGRVFFPHFGYRVQDRLFIVIGSGDLILPFTYVENAVNGIYQASVQDAAIGAAYNLVDDGTMTVTDYLRRFIEVTGIQARIVSVPYFVPYVATKGYEVAAHWNLVKAGKTSADQLRWKQKKVRFDNSKAKNELMWSPKVSLDEGLTRTFQWYKSQYQC